MAASEDHMKSPSIRNGTGNTRIHFCEPPLTRAIQSVAGSRPRYH